MNDFIWRSLYLLFFFSLAIGALWLPLQRRADWKSPRNWTVAMVSGLPAVWAFLWIAEGVLFNKEPSYLPFEIIAASCVVSVGFWALFVE